MTVCSEGVVSELNCQRIVIAWWKIPVWTRSWKINFLLLNRLSFILYTISLTLILIAMLHENRLSTFERSIRLRVHLCSEPISIRSTFFTKRKIHNAFFSWRFSSHFSLMSRLLDCVSISVAPYLTRKIKFSLHVSLILWIYLI